MNGLKKFIIAIFIVGFMVATSFVITPNFSNRYTVEAASIKLNKTKYTMIKGQKYTLKIKGTKGKMV